MVVVVELLPHRHRHRHRVTNRHRSGKVQRRFDEHGSRPRKLRAERGRQQRGGPHAVRDEVLEQAAVPELGTRQRGIHVAGHQREKLDVLWAQRAHQRRTVADVDFVVGSTFEIFERCLKVHDGAPVDAHQSDRNAVGIGTTRRRHRVRVPPRLSAIRPAGRCVAHDGPDGDTRSDIIMLQCSTK